MGVIRRAISIATGVNSTATALAQVLQGRPIEYLEAAPKPPPSKPFEEARGIFTEDVCRFYSANIASAFEYLHERKIVYRDLKPENLLLDAKGYLKVTDFGCARKLQDGGWSTPQGHPQFCAPELLDPNGGGSNLIIGEQADVMMCDAC